MRFWGKDVPYFLVFDTSGQKLQHKSDPGVYCSKDKLINRFFIDNRPLKRQYWIISLHCPEITLTAEHVLGNFLCCFDFQPFGTFLALPVPKKKYSCTCVYADDLPLT